jgi:hypothetical protein
MAHIDGWALIARIAANQHRFSACTAMAQSTALLLLRNQLMTGVRNASDLRGVTEAVGAEVMAGAIGAMAAYEVRRILNNVDPGGDASALSPGDARRVLAQLASSGPVPAPAPGGESEVAFEPARPLRHHKAMSARRRERVN